MPPMLWGKVEEGMWEVHRMDLRSFNSIVGSQQQIWGRQRYLQSNFEGLEILV